MGFFSFLVDIFSPGFRLNEDDMVVFVVGPSGSGKTSFIKAAAVAENCPYIIVDPLQPSMEKVKATRYTLSTSAKSDLGTTKKHIVFVDTPSFHTGWNDEAAESQMMDWLSKSRSKADSVGTIYMHRIETDPVYESMQKHLNTFAYAFPQDFSYYPSRLRAVLSYEGTISATTIASRREAFEEQLRTLRPSFRFRRSLSWNTSIHPGLFRLNDYDVAWGAVVALFRR